MKISKEGKKDLKDTVEFMRDLRIKKYSWRLGDVTMEVEIK